MVPDEVVIIGVVPSQAETVYHFPAHQGAVQTHLKLQIAGLSRRSPLRGFQPGVRVFRDAAAILQAIEHQRVPGGRHGIERISAAVPVSSFQGQGIAHEGLYVHCRILQAHAFKRGILLLHTLIGLETEYDPREQSLHIQTQHSILRRGIILKHGSHRHIALSVLHVEGRERESQAFEFFLSGQSGQCALPEVVIDVCDSIETVAAPLQETEHGVRPGFKVAVALQPAFTEYPEADVVYPVPYSRIYAPAPGSGSEGQGYLHLAFPLFLLQGKPFLPASSQETEKQNCCKCLSHCHLYSLRFLTPGIP